MPLDAPFHPLVAGWFAERFAAPTPPQTEGWREIASGRDVLIAAPTGSGKTLAAFLWSLNCLVERALDGGLADSTQVLYVSPLKALGNDVEKNLQEPLSGIRAYALRGGAGGPPQILPEIRVAVRSGDTPMADRNRMLRQPPHILITTPESLYILLTAEGSRKFLASTETVIVDEIHAVAGDKRGAHLALSLERLDHLVGRRVQRIGLSATQKPIEEIAQLLVGCPLAPQPPSIVDTGHRREMELAIEVPDQELGPIATHELWDEVYERIVRQVEAHRTTLVFVNTRRQVERVAYALGERLGSDRVAAHHGSLSRETRLQAEQRLKHGEIPVMVATASLELGIDIGHVDLVCHIGAPRLISTLLQRVGRSGHWLGAIPKGIIYPLTRDDLLQAAAAIRAVRQGELDRIVIPEQPLDILAQQIVATVATGEIDEEELLQLVRRAYPFHNLPRSVFDQVVEMLSEGIATNRGRRSAHLHRDQVHGILRARRGARLAAITSGGAIPDLANYDVVEEPAGTFVGQLHEDFAVESLAGDVFLLGNHSWRIRRVEQGRVRVEDAAGAAPTMPFWLGEAPARSPELSRAVSELREEVAKRLQASLAVIDPRPLEAISWLEAETGVCRAGAEQIADYVGDTLRLLGAVPTQHTVVAERFFDESGGMQLVLHTPFGGRINRAWGLAMRKRFCVTFDFELQAAATDDGILISLGEQHSFPLDSAFAMVRLATLQQDLTQAALQAPMFANRWRWNATRSLALLRSRGGKRVPINIQRMQAEDLLAAVFPDQLACQDNHGAGPIALPDHPLVNETIDNCLREAMDLDGLRDVLTAIECGKILTVAVETPGPSLMSHEILAANPYAYLDDAPLEERRARAVALRRTDPDLASGIGALDPEAIAAVRSQAWPDVRDAEELHDVLLSLGVLPLDSIEASWRPYADRLLEQGRVTTASWPARRALVAAERIGLVQAALDDVAFDPAIVPPQGARAIPPDQAVEAIVRGWLEILGPATAAELAERTGLRLGAVEMALPVLEASGVVLRGQFTGGVASGGEWCERRLLARIHRLTLGRLRQEIQPVTTAEFLRFLLRWQHVAPSTQLHGRDGLLEVIGQLQGIEIPAPAWESWVLKSRVARYDPADLEQLCLSGLVAWGRLSTREPAIEDDEPRSSPAGSTAAFTRARAKGKRPQLPGRQAPLAFLLREDLFTFLPERLPLDQIAGLSHPAREVADFLARRGASFLADLARGTGRLAAEVEDALWELVARGLVTGDGVAGLRVLLQPEAKRRSSQPRLVRVVGGRHGPHRQLPVGRWALWGEEPADLSPEARAELIARQLLRRYGVVFRDLLARERQASPWRVLLGIYRRLEARGEIRGGRFVAGFIGEQYALPEAVEALRTVRRQPANGETVVVGSGDPLNLVGILTPGTRISPYANQVIAYRDGVPVEVGPLGAVQSRLRYASNT
jgi:ATP-dependent Lhr-like helicase